MDSESPSSQQVETTGPVAIPSPYGGPLMIDRLPVLLSALILLLAVNLSCSRGNTVTQPPCNPEPVGVHQSTDAGRYLWALYMFYVDSAENKVEAIPLRKAVEHWNVLKFLEQWPCTNCVSILGVADSGYGTKLFDVKITHPFANPNITGFDVRGIAMFHGSHSFTESGVIAPDRYAGDGELVNADGYTTLYNISTQGAGPDGLQGYIKGNFAGLMAPTATLNGYKRHNSPGVTNTRNVFIAGEEIVETYDIDMPDGAFIFGYAVDANWVPATTKPVTNPITDFPPEANCPEPWKIEVAQEPIGYGLTDFGGSVQLTIDVYDHQGKDSHDLPVLECLELFAGTLTGAWEQDGDGFARYKVTVENVKLAAAGEYRLLVSVEDNENADAPAWLDLTAYSVCILEVIPKGWAQTWGGSENDRGHAVVTDNGGNVYVAGGFAGTADFDPGPDWDLQTWDGGGAFLSKYSSSGEYQWALTWGGLAWPQTALAHGVAMDSSGYLYVAGEYYGTVDLDPGPGNEPDHDTGTYLTKFDLDGNYIWSRTWEAGVCEDVAVHASDSVYVTGGFNYTVDFDPGPEVEERSSTATGPIDIYLSKFDTSGEFQWVQTWGGIQNDFGQSVDVDASGNPFVTGYFKSIVDFDPGDEIDEHEAHGIEEDPFLSAFNSAGEFQWARTWGGTGYGDHGQAVAVSPNGNIHVVGSLWGTVDFDPGSGVNEQTSSAFSDVYLTTFNSSGDHQWVRVFGGTHYDGPRDIFPDSSGYLYLTGFFNQTTDLDPGPAVDEHVSNGWSDVFLSKFTSDGMFEWGRSWGGTGGDEGICVYAGSDGVYGSGTFTHTVDFDPGPGIDEHTAAGSVDAFLTRFAPNGNW